MVDKVVENRRVVAISIAVADIAFLWLAVKVGGGGGRADELRGWTLCCVHPCTLPTLGPRA